VVVSTTLRPPCLRGKKHGTHYTASWVAPRAGLDAAACKKFKQKNWPGSLTNPSVLSKTSDACTEYCMLLKSESSADTHCCFHSVPMTDVTKEHILNLNCSPDMKLLNLIHL
jgi:hypothetical protein